MSERSRRYRPKRSLPPGMTLIELLVVMAIIGVLASLMVSGVQRAMAVSRTLQCTAHLRNLGLGLHMYQDTRGHYPCEAETQESFYLCLLDYVDAGHQRDAVSKGGSSAAEPVRAFLCPGRRDIMVGAKGDYGYGSSPGGGLRSILGSQTPVSSTMVVAANGASNTLLLSHKGLSPRDYGGNGAKDTSWAVVSENSREPTRLVKDTDQEEMSKLLGDRTSWRRVAVRRHQRPQGPVRIQQHADRRPAADEPALVVQRRQGAGTASAVACETERGA